MKRRVALALGTAVAILCFAECAVRFVPLPSFRGIHSRDPLLFWRLKPDIRQRTLEFREGTGEVNRMVVSTNSLGLRDDEIPPRVPGELRVLALGDSSIFGHGVALEETFERQLQQMLAEGSKGAPVRVINGGVSGYSSFQGRSWFHELAPRLRPDLVVVGYWFNDIGQDTVEDKARSPRLAVPWSVVGVLSHSQLYRHLATALEPYPELAPPRDGVLVHRVGLVDYLANLSAIFDEAERGGARCVYLLLQPRDQVDAGGETLQWRQAVHELCVARGVPVVDMMGPLAQQADRRTFFIDNIHPSPLGHRLIASELLRALREAGLVPALSPSPSPSPLSSPAAR